MGVRFRKSVNLGGGFRVNVSKSGIGYSRGTKGYRYTKTAKGSSRRTYSIPGTGLSYVSESGRSKRPSSESHARGASHSQQAEVSNAVSTESVNAGDYQPAEYEELLVQMRKAQRLDYLSSWLIATIILAALPPFILTAFAGAVLKIAVRSKMRVPMEYSFDDESRAAYEDLSAIWMSLNKNNRFWQAVSETNLDRKTSGGAARGVKRIPARATNKLPFFVESNVQPFGLKLRKQRVYFLPDKVLVVARTDVAQGEQVRLAGRRKPCPQLSQRVLRRDDGRPHSLVSRVDDGEQRHERPPRARLLAQVVQNEHLARGVPLERPFARASSVEGLPDVREDRDSGGEDGPQATVRGGDRDRRGVVGLPVM